MLVLKKKELVAAALVVLIGVAGYLNWSYQDTVRVTDGADYIETGKKLGEAQYVNADADSVSETDDNTIAKADKKDSSKKAAENTDSGKKDDSADKTAKSSSDYFSRAKIEKDSSRSKALEILNKTAENESFDENTRINAQQKILDMASNAEKETLLEGLARAKGYDKISVYIEGESADIVVDKTDFSDKDAGIIKEIVAEQVNVAPSNIKIVTLK